MTRARMIVGAVLLVLVGLWLGRMSAPQAPGVAETERAPATRTWTCSMHPQIQLPEPGACPICGMDLIPADTGGGGDVALELSASAAALASVRTAPVERRFAAAEVRLVGRIEPDETRTHTATARVGGRLDRLFIDFTGMEVRRGDHMVEIYSPELVTAQDEFLQARRAAAGRSDGGRLSEVARTTLEAAREKLRLLGLTEGQIERLAERGTAQERVTILAPMDGTVLAKHVVEGRYVQEGTPIYEMADLTRLWVQLEAYESDLPWIRYGQPVEFTTTALPGRHFHGTVSFVDPVVDPTTRSARVRLSVDNEDRSLKPGMFVRATLEARVAAGGRVVTADLAGKRMCPMHPDVVSDGPGSCSVCGMALVKVEKLGFEAIDESKLTAPLLVPATAPLLTGRRAIVYVATEHDEMLHFTPREVVLGPRLGDHYVVEEGLDEGERVVVEGAFKIDSDLQIRGRPSMMSAEAVENEPLPLDREPIDTHAVPEEFLAQVTRVVEAAARLAAALAADDDDAALGAAGEAAAALDAVKDDGLSKDARADWTDRRVALGSALQLATRAESIASRRAALRELTAPLVRTVRAFGLSEGARTHLMFCPMAFDDEGALWLQGEGELANPYFGASMLRCGSELAVYGGPPE